MSAQTEDPIAVGREALRSGDAAGARLAFEAALVATSRRGDALEGLARAAYIELDFTAAIARWNEAYAAHRAADDQ
ncbi:MAG TPA: hypothetical protein VKD67_13460, partial [Acidimicrobiales bacterium]|nr:hypothetical protein [Acidimicrobiales bacterium]